MTTFRVQIATEGNPYGDDRHTIIAEGALQMPDSQVPVTWGFGGPVIGSAANFHREGNAVFVDVDIVESDKLAEAMAEHGDHLEGEPFVQPFTQRENLVISGDVRTISVKIADDVKKQLDES